MALEQVAVGADALGRERLGAGVRTDELAERAVDAGVGLARQLGGLATGELRGDRAQRAGVEQLAARELDARQLCCLGRPVRGARGGPASPKATQISAPLGLGRRNRAGGLGTEPDRP